MKKLNRAFTLVELIVAITIIAILGTIAFISMQSYSANARDSTRISDLSAMKTSLELFQLDAGKYPDPTDGFTVTYSGSEVWTQGIFGETTFTNISKLDKIPTDPLTVKEYTYSVTKTRQEYQFAGIVEGDELTLNPAILQTNAGDVMATALVTGTYNGQILKTESGTNCNILSLPSIVSSEPNTITDLGVILTNQSLVYNGYKNLPTNYISSKYKSDGGFMFTSNKIVVYDDSASCTPLYNPDDNTARVELLTNLQQAYSGTLIENEDNISGVVNIDLTDTGSLNIISSTLVNNNLGGDLAISNTSSSGGVGGETLACDLTQAQLDSLNGYLLSGEIFVLDSERHTLSPSTDSDWCNNISELGWVGGPIIPAEIWKLKNIPSLNLEYNGITTLPTEIGNLTNLSTLGLNNNLLTTIPAEIRNLINLYYLNLEYNGIITLPPQIGDLANLEYLLLSNNQLTLLPNELINLTILRTLDLWNNEGLGNLSNSISWDNLNSYYQGNITTSGDGLEISGDGVSKIIIKVPEPCMTETEFNTLKTYEGEDLAIYRDIDGQRLYTYNTLEDWCSAKQVFWAGGSSIPAEMWNLKNLENIGLANSSLTEIPQGLFNLTKLTFLDLSGNNLTVIPSEISLLWNLVELRLGGNQLTSLPEAIRDLGGLEYFFLLGNEGLGNLDFNFNPWSESREQYEIPYSGRSIIIEGDGGSIRIYIHEPH